MFRSKFQPKNIAASERKITLRMFSVSSAGPLDEKYATAGAGLYLGTLTVGRIVAVGFLLSRHS